MDGLLFTMPAGDYSYIHVHCIYIYLKVVDNWWSVHDCDIVSCYPYLKCVLFPEYTVVIEYCILLGIILLLVCGVRSIFTWRRLSSYGFPWYKYVYIQYGSKKSLRSGGNRHSVNSVIQTIVTPLL